MELTQLLGLGPVYTKGDHKRVTPSFCPLPSWSDLEIAEYLRLYLCEAVDRKPTISVSPWWYAADPEKQQMCDGFKIRISFRTPSGTTGRDFIAKRSEILSPVGQHSMSLFVEQINQLASQLP